MTQEHHLPQLAVSDLRVSRDWYSRLWARGPDADSDGRCAWEVSRGRVLTVVQRTPATETTFAIVPVDDLGAVAAGLHHRGIRARLKLGRCYRYAIVDDPDGNTVLLVQSTGQVADTDVVEGGIQPT